MQYLQYQLHVSASTLAIIRLALNLSRDYTICMVCWEGTRSRFTIVGSMKIRTWDRVTNIWCLVMEHLVASCVDWFKSHRLLCVSTHPLTISKYTEETTWLKPLHTRCSKVLHDRTTSDVSNSIPSSDFHPTHYCKTSSHPPPPRAHHTHCIVTW
jgi:hypothetical protein